MRNYEFVKGLIGEPDSLRISTPDGGVVVRNIDFEYNHHNPSTEQKVALDNFITYHINSWLEQYQRVYQGESLDSFIGHEDTFVGGVLKKRAYNDYNNHSYKLKQKLADLFPEYYNRQFFPGSPSCFDIFEYDKLNRYQISEYADSSKIELNYQCITNHILFENLPALFAAFHTINFYSTYGINFTLIHDCDNKTKNIKWTVPSNPSIDDHLNIPDIRRELVFASEREFDQKGETVMCTAKIYADAEYVKDLCDKCDLQYPLPEDLEPWAYSISFNRDGIQEIAAHVNSYYK